MSEIYGTDNSENLYLDSYSDMIYYYDDGLAYYGTEGNDSFYSGNGNDTLIGSTGDDSLDGGNGNDILYGGIGNDTLVGGIGNDILHDYEGNNNFYGGGGSDTFYIFDTSTFSGVTNTVLDFSPGEDKIALNLVSFDDLYISQSTGTSSADIYRASNSQLLAHIDMTTSHTLTSADFREYVEGDVW